MVENNSKAPPPAKKAADAAAPLTSVVVLGNSMADWLAYGLEQAAAESPDIGILRRHRTNSGLIRIEVKNDPRGEYPDWPQAARDILNADKASFIVVMIGLNDRRPIRDKAPAPAKTQCAGRARSTPRRPTRAARRRTPRRMPDDAPAEQQAATVEQPPERAPAGMVNYEFRSDKWTELYIKRIDDLIAVLKAKNVPVFWVGLPPVRNPKISADLSYLNDLYRSRAEKAGITYIDTWDGFVDEQGRFVMQGPDFEGQIRRLRSGDGIHFTQSGARKLAHYVEREIQRALMTHATPVALPADEPAPQATAPTPPKPGNAAIARPLAGPVMPLTTAAEADELLGGASARAGHGRSDRVARAGARRAQPGAGRPRRRLRLAAPHRAAARRRPGGRDLHHAAHPDAALRDAPGLGRAGRGAAAGRLRAGRARPGPPGRDRPAGAAAADLVLRQLAAATAAATGAAPDRAGATAVLLPVLRRALAAERPAYATSAISSRTSAHVLQRPHALARRARAPRSIAGAACSAKGR